MESSDRSATIRVGQADGTKPAVHVIGAGRVGLQWLRVYMRSKMIKHMFECVDDKFALLDELHIY